MKVSTIKCSPSLLYPWKLQIFLKKHLTLTFSIANWLVFMMLRFQTPTSTLT